MPTSISGEDTTVGFIERKIDSFHLTAPVKRPNVNIRSKAAPLKPRPSFGAILRELRDDYTFEAQLFNDKDTTLILPKGTRLVIPANAFSIPGGSANIIDLRVQEYYSLVDIFSANLSTTTKDAVLETGGMLQMAASSSGEECVLDEGKEIEIHFPFSVFKSDMRLFVGKRDLMERMIWEESVNREVTKRYSDITEAVEQMPEFPGGYQGLMRYLNKTLKYPADARKMGAEGTVFVQFIVDESGSVIDPSVLRGVHKSIDKEAIDVVSTMPKWNPGFREGKTRQVRMTLPIRFRLDGRGLLNFPMPYPGASDPQLDEKNMTDSLLKKATTNDLSYYILKTAKLGWINCDRFINARDLITFKVYVPDVSDYEVDVKLIFEKIRAVIPGQKVGNYVYFHNVPKNEWVSILALRINNHGLEMMTKRIKLTTQLPDSLLPFDTVTIKALKEFLQTLDNN